jgi:hypothetical protein
MVIFIFTATSYSLLIPDFFLCGKLKYHDNGKEKECLPRVGQWDMKNKVNIQFSELGISHMSQSSCCAGLGGASVFTELKSFSCRKL